MAEIKQSIGLLCKHLNFLFGMDLKPEYFRLAKFNKNDENVVNIFWELLNKFTINKPNCNVMEIKSHLKSLKYPNKGLFSLNEDKNSGSRELLIAACYLLCHRLDDLIIAEAQKSPLNELFHLSNIKRKYEMKREVPTIKEEETRDNYENYLKFITGKLELNLRMVHEYKKQNSIFLKKLQDKAGGSYTPNEVLALNSNQWGKIYLKTTERIISILENHKKWTIKENIFWNWMDTVLEENQKNKVI